MKSLLSNPRARQALALGAGTALGQFAVLAASPIWSRLYAPEDFGRYGVMLSFMSVCVAVVALRYDVAIPLAHTEDEATDLVLISLSATLPLVMLSGAAYSILAFCKVWGFGVVAPWTGVVVTIALLFTSVFSTFRYWHVRHGDFRQISFAMVAQGVGRAATPILLAPLGLGWLGLLAGELAGRALGVRSLAARVWRPILMSAKTLPASRLWGLAARYKQYPLVFLPSALLDAAGGAIAVPTFIALHGASAGGEFLLAQQVVAAPAALICNSLGDVFHSRLLPAQQDPHASISKLVWQTCLALMALASCVYVPLALTASSLGSAIFGPRWQEVGYFIAINALPTIITVGVSPVTRAMLLSRIPQIKLAADIVKIVLPVTGMLLGYRLSGGDQRGTLYGFAAMLSLSYVIYFAVVLISVRLKNLLPVLSAI